ncbi:MAG: ATP-dependent sacrificial sulfur transferase LarE [Thermoguttaceae bacterium]
MHDISPELTVKRDRLLELLRSYGSCAVAFSGGLDSTVVAKAAQVALGARAVAVTGASASLAVGELQEARQLAAAIGIRHEIIETQELAIPQYQENTGNRCFYCKNELFARMEQITSRLDVAVIVDGSNHDDQGDHRPGLQAARQRQVRSPLAECGLTKAEVRQLALHWELPTWDKPAAPCLSSRIAYGEKVTPERLKMIEGAEQFLRGRGFQPLRVRYHRGDVARIEVALDAVPRLVEPQLRREVTEHFKSLGFKYVSLDLEGFRSGSLNAALPLESRVSLSPGGRG